MQWKAIAQFLTPQVFKLIWNFIRFNYYLMYFLLQTSNILYLIQKQLAGGGRGVRGGEGKMLLGEEVERLSLYENSLKNKSK